MSFLDYLVETFGNNNPIFSNEIEFKDYSKPWINKELARLCDEGSLIRFEKGVYYIPNITQIGLSKLSPRKVIEKKYITNGVKVNGYYSGMSFMNMIGLSTQVPNVIEIYTNDEKSKVREIQVDNQKVILRKARVKISKENVAVLSFLELMNYIPASYFDDNRKLIAKNYIIDNKITRKDISKYASEFPDKAIRTLVESEIVYYVTQ